MQAKPVQIIAPQALSNAIAVLYTSPNNKKTIVNKLTVANTGAVAVTADIHVVPAGGSPDDTNKLIPAKVIDGNTSFAAYQLEGQILNAGDSVQAVASVDAVANVMASGVEVF